MAKHGLVGFMDIFRMASILLITLIVAVFIAPLASWVLWLSVFACFYVFGLEFLKFYLGMKQLRSKSRVIPDY